MPELSDANWNYPTSILFGNGRIRELPEICAVMNIQRPLIVTDQGLADFEFIKKISLSLNSAGVFSDVKANPNGENITQGVSVFKVGQHDGVIAVGGGSALDAAKAIALMCHQTRPIWDFEDIGDNWKRVDTDVMAPVIAIPTTAGTGSEVGRASVIVDESTHSKKIIFHPNMLPAKVILDPELTQKLPPHITSATGIDAFVHCFEAFCAPGFHPMADGIAIKGMSMIKEWLPIAYQDGEHLIARGNMLTASTMGATAFQKGLGAIHALAHPLGAIYDKHHGLLNAIIMPYVLVANKSAIESKVHILCTNLGLKPDFNVFCEWVLSFRKTLGIPNTLAEIGIDTDRSKEIGELAFADAAASGNPIAFSKKNYQVLFEKAVKGIV